LNWIGLAVKVRVAPRASSPLMTEVLATLEDEAVTLPPSVRVPVGVTVGAAVPPPLLLKTNPFRMLLPASVRVPRPFRVTT